MGSYIFADYPFNIVFENEKTNYGDFYSAEVDAAKNTITVCDFNCVGASCYGVEYLIEKHDRVIRSQLNPTSMLFANSDWSNVKICRGNNGQYSEELMITAVYSALSKLNTLLLHASLVDYHGNGIVFTGPSGIGKTTQAQLWEKHLGATIVNGDKVFIRMIDDNVFGYGAPWRGSSPYCLNKKNDLKAIVVLSQGSENKLKKIDNLEAINKVLPHIFIPGWDENCVNQVLATLEKILKKVAIYHLECRPDEESVLLLKNTMFE